MVQSQISEQRQVVQFCPCGHTCSLSSQEIIDLGGAGQLQKIKDGIKLDAPIFHSSDCPVCIEEANNHASLFDY